ncbi:hypothetical protein LX87_05633 [Larkinella arboricola]|uniref:Uncharacterized protein n=1 Tax=Larkinella arboricola TaxID=643671 RepID=A0A327WJ79_LARAB|nr:hypothetical protein LX87_05633 [Larkinella arboricola]
MGTFLYTYGLFAITGYFTSIYPIYLGIFGLSIYSLVFGLSSFKSMTGQLNLLPGRLRRFIAIFLSVICFLFVFLWISVLFPLSSSHSRPDTYAVFILDLCVVLPGLAITAFLLFRSIPFGDLLAGVFLIKVVTLILPVAIGEIILLPHHRLADYGMASIYGVIVVLSLFLSVIYLWKLRIGTPYS